MMSECSEREFRSARVFHHIGSICAPFAKRERRLLRTVLPSVQITMCIKKQTKRNVNERKKRK